MLLENNQNKVIAEIIQKSQLKRTSGFFHNKIQWKRGISRLQSKSHTRTNIKTKKAFIKKHIFKITQNKTLRIYHHQSRPATPLTHWMLKR